MGEAIPIEDFVWCDACGEPHALFEDTLHLTGEDVQGMACQEPDVVGAKTWEDESKHLAFYGDKGGYDLYLRCPPVNLDIHRPMFFVEAS